MGQLIEKLNADFTKLLIEHAKKHISKFKLSPIQKKRLRIRLMEYYKSQGIRGKKREIIVNQSIIIFEILLIVELKKLTVDTMKNVR